MPTTNHSPERRGQACTWLSKAHDWERQHLLPRGGSAASPGQPATQEGELARAAPPGGGGAPRREAGASSGTEGASPGSSRLGWGSRGREQARGVAVLTEDHPSRSLEEAGGNGAFRPTVFSSRGGKIISCGSRHEIFSDYNCGLKIPNIENNFPTLL